MKRFVILIVSGFIFLWQFQPVGAQVHSGGSLAVLPFYPLNLDAQISLSAESLLQLELEKLQAFAIIPEEKTLAVLGEEYCSEFACAVELGKKLQADQVVTGKLVALGENIIVQFMLIDVKDEQILLLDQIKAVSVEDLDTVMRRIALSLFRQEPIEKTAEIGTITAQETVTPRRRQARGMTGFLFGYLYPHIGYDEGERSFTVEFRTGAELKKLTFGTQLAARKGFAMNLFADYLPRQSDFCPFIGAGFGFHWVSHSPTYSPFYDQYGMLHYSRKKKGDGFEITTEGGLIAFRTYNFRLMAKFAFLFTLNDYNDQAFVFTLGLMH